MNVDHRLVQALAPRVAQLILANLRRQVRPKRDLDLEVAEYLQLYPRSSSIEVERGVGARGQDVRHVLASNDRFQEAPRRSGLPSNTKCWILCSEPLSARPRTADEAPDHHQAEDQDR